MTKRAGGRGRETGVPMRYRAVVVALGVCVAWAVTAGVAAWLALRHVPGFYRQATRSDPVAQRKASDELLSRVSSVVNQARREGAWSVWLTEQQLNGWLAVDLVENHATLVPESVANPRVHITEHGLYVACRYREGWLSPVLRVELDIRVVEPNVVAVRVLGVRAGRLPLPLKRLLQGIADAAARMNLRLRWYESASGPVAMIELPPIENDGVSFSIERLEMSSGRLLAAGHCRRANSSESLQRDEPAPTLADHSRTTDSRQR